MINSSVPPVRVSSYPSLTTRERQILALIADEMTSQQIAKQLFISPNTVENHRFKILSKLGVRNSVGLVRKAMQLGLIN